MSYHYSSGSSSSGSSGSTSSSASSGSTSSSGSSGSSSSSSYLPSSSSSSSSSLSSIGSSPIVSGSVYYLQGQSNSGNTDGLTGYFYPLYTDESLISRIGQYHSHTFEGLDQVFYMPSGEINHGVSSPPSSTYYRNFMYQEYATYNVTNGTISYTNISTTPSQSAIAIASVSNSGTVPQNLETTRTSTLIPEQLIGKAQGLIQLLKDYYNYLNTEGLPSYEINLILDNHDIDRVSAKYLGSIGSEIAKNVPNSNVLDQVSLYKKIVKFYSTRGSEDSLFAFFRIFFDEAVSISYPKERLFKLSDGAWKPRAENNEVEIIGNLSSGDLNNEDINTVFNINDAQGNKLGSGQLSSFANVDALFDYDNVEEGLQIAFDSKQNATDTTWISNTDYPWVGNNRGNVAYDGQSFEFAFPGDATDYITAGIIGNQSSSLITNDHSIVARVRRGSDGGQYQGVFSASALSLPHAGHELYIDRDTGKLGRQFVDIDNPMIVADGSNIRIRNFKSMNNWRGNLGDTASSGETYYKNTAYASGTGLYNGKPFYVDNIYYFGATSISLATPYTTWDENTGFGTVENWPVAKIYYDGNKWVFKGAAVWNLITQTFSSTGVILCYSEDTSEDVFSANIEWFNESGSPIGNAFVNTPIELDATFNFSSQSIIPVDNQYHTIALTGKKARKGGYIKVSIDGGAWETVISGDTSAHLAVDSNTDIIIGKGSVYPFKGSMTNVQYYNTALSAADVLQVHNYYIGVVLDFYQITFENKDGSYVNGSTLVEAKEKAYTLNVLSGHEIDSFVEFEEPTLDESGVGPTVRIKVEYNQALSGEKQTVRWGDSRFDLFSSGNNVRHTYTPKDIGAYENSRSFASDINRLHDGDFWQEFSYVLNVGLSSDKWQNEYIRMVHPAGLKFFASVLYILSLENSWLGPKVRFDEVLRQYKRTYDTTKYAGNYRTNNPLSDLDWMEGLTPPSILDPSANAHHMPLFQPGWLTGDLRFLELIIEAFQFDIGPNDPAYQRMVLSVLHLLHITTKDRDAFAREDYLENLKFIDVEPITPYLNITFEEAVFNNPKIFNNIRSIIDITIVTETRLETEVDGFDMTTEDKDATDPEGDSYLVK
jgi:hypothetical protein